MSTERIFMPELIDGHRRELSDEQGIRDCVHKYGYVIVPNVLSTNEIDSIYSMYTNDVNTVIKDKRNKVSVNAMKAFDCTDDQIPVSHMDRTLGLAGLYGTCQGSAAWNVRSNSNVQRAFSILHEDTDLVCSMDAIGYSNKSNPVTGADWLHVDQMPGLRGSDIKCYQGIVYCSNVIDSSYATTMVIPGSHKLWDKVTYGYRSIRHFFILPREHPMKADLALGAKLLKMNKGDLLLWDSRLVHQGWTGKSRFCFMVSYGKRSDRSELDRIVKQHMYLFGYKSTHWSIYGEINGDKFCREKDFDFFRPALKKPLPTKLANISHLPIRRLNADVNLDEYIPDHINELL